MFNRYVKLPWKIFGPGKPLRPVPSSATSSKPLKASAAGSVARKQFWRRHKAQHSPTPSRLLPPAEQIRGNFNLRCFLTSRNHQAVKKKHAHVSRISRFTQIESILFTVDQRRFFHVSHGRWDLSHGKSVVLKA